MRGEDGRSGKLFSIVGLEARVPAQHPLRAIRGIANEALAGLSAEFQALYAHTGRPGMAPERLLRALSLQGFTSIRSEPRLMQELEYKLLYRWFVGLGIDDPVWDATVFCKNRDRLLAGGEARRFPASLLALPRIKRLLSDERFSVDGALIEAWASIKSFRPRGEVDAGGASGAGGRSQERDFHGLKWSNESDRSTTDGDARLYRKGQGKEARRCYLGHALMENRHGLVVDGQVSRATGEAERLAAEVMPMRRRRSNIAGAAAESEGYAASQRARKRIEEAFAWVKGIAGQGKTRHRGLDRVGWRFTLAPAAYNLIRLPKLLAEAPK